MVKKQNFSIKQRFYKKNEATSNVKDNELFNGNSVVDTLSKEEYELKERERIALIKHYERNYYENYNMLEYMLKNNINKAFIIYQLGWLIELVLKYELRKFTNLKINEISNYKHDIFSLMKKVQDNNCSIIVRTNINKLKVQLSLFKDDFGNKINFFKFTDYRYNHEKDKESLITTSILTKEESEKIEEVLSCLNIIMSQ